jgi:1-acyl-sn-glycerol-3-phosphate acyltransferase
MQDRKPLQNIPKVNIVLSWIASLIIWAMGWRLKGWPPDVPKAVYVGGPHTANFDVFLLVMMSWKMRIKMSFLVGNDIPFPLNILSVWANGIPIDRNNPDNNTVDQVVEYINQTDKVALTIAPEGRLRRVEYWRSGFYYIALGAAIPIIPGYLDYARKEIGLADPITPSGDIEADMERLRGLYDGVTARFPEKASPVRVRPRTQAMQDRLAERAKRLAASSPVTDEASQTQQES